tara:strand:- start:581 stop:1162 length:582 start_codon:yes stop_codon:yes gene_type:complete
MATVTFQEFDFVKKNMEFSDQAKKGYSVKKDRVAWNLVTSGNNSGTCVEHLVAQKFRGMGYEVEMTTKNYHYDMRVIDNSGNILKIEVKSAQYNMNRKSFVFQAVKPSHADIFVFCAITATGLEIRFATKAELVRSIKNNRLTEQWNGIRRLGYYLSWSCPSNAKEALKIHWPTEDLDAFPPVWAMNIYKFTD